jgi:murein DD-endopeptidase MepM/ murein hydrolase activator NlpD
MRLASKTRVPWGVAAASLVLAGTMTLVAAAPASAQTAPSPNPLSNLLPNLLGPLAPLVSPAAPAQAPASSSGGSSAAKPATSGGSSTSGSSAALNAAIPSNVEDKCGPAPVPLVFNRTPGRTTQQLIAEAQNDAPAGTTVQQELVDIAAPFPVAGSAHYQDDWGAWRTTPCPHLHQGNDIFAPAGTPAVAPENGVLVREDYEAVGGNSYYFAGDDGYSFYGAHLASFAPGLHGGEHVTAGTVLGYVGNTGDAAGGPTHLHFELFAPGKAWGTPEDPKFWLDAALNTAITKAGGVVNTAPDSVAAQAAPGQAQINAGSLMSSVVLAGGHIISQPTVPVVFLVLVLLAVLVVSQTRTFKVAGELRRSRSEAAVPTFLVGGTAGLVAASEEATPRRRGRRRGVEEEPAVDTGPLPPWAAMGQTVAPPPPKQSLKERASERMNRLTTTLDAKASSRASGPGRDEAGSGTSPRGGGRGAATSVMERERDKSPRASWTPPGSSSANGKRGGSPFSRKP